ncbi:MAG: Stp1/IreP family PP2C-type Ser/Thr phosphatase [Candidatus Faecousia sp.]|uniref:Stp1/IreP family PP2C-type Ser/Thr phosphatase n=1 Tax=Faecousia sp. TaxID=2952921 RepID=UPI002A8DE3C8|nr:Stp1/IreP family PP2C-type Ser/Thr phosphatase [Candidatus Faecousia sp.]
MEAWGLTDVGNVRSQNQDAFRIVELGKDALLAVVCDGMGGAKSGNVASRLASEVFSEEVKRSFSADLTPDEAEQMLRAAANLANISVFEQSQLSEDYAGMGTTLVAALTYPRATLVLNIGDSRAYLINADGVQCITRDHSVVEMMVQRGELTPEQAKTHPSKNLITRAVGTEETVFSDVFRVETEPEDCILLCSDGLSNQMADQEILFEVVHGARRDDCCRRLLEIAKNRGAPDNVTSVLIEL